MHKYKLLTTNLHKNHSFSDENLNSCQVVEHTVDGDKKEKTVPATDRNSNYYCYYFYYY